MLLKCGVYLPMAVMLDLAGGRLVYAQVQTDKQQRQAIKIKEKAESIGRD